MSIHYPSSLHPPRTPAMTETSDPTCLGGRVVFLIDESEALRERIAGGTKTKAESIATALNSLLNQLASVPDLEVAVAGYRGDGSGADVGCRWAGPLAGRRFVPTSALADAPLAVETRVRRVPAMLAGRREEIGAVPDLVRAAAGRRPSFPCWATAIAGTWSSPALRRKRPGAGRRW